MATTTTLAPVFDYACPKCGAAVGNSCTTVSGKTASTSHKERTALRDAAAAEAPKAAPKTKKAKAEKPKAEATEDKPKKRRGPAPTGRTPKATGEEGCSLSRARRWAQRIDATATVSAAVKQEDGTMRVHVGYGEGGTLGEYVGPDARRTYALVRHWAMATLAEQEAALAAADAATEAAAEAATTE